MTFNLLEREDGDVTVIVVRGELDVLTAGRLGLAVDRKLRTCSADLVVDLCGTEFIDSAGLHILLNAQRRLTRQGRTLSVICPPGPQRRVFELAKLIDTLGVVRSLAERRRRPAGLAS